MDLGLLIFPTDQTIGVIELATVAEERGFESIWFPEHSHIPVSRDTPWGGRAGAPPLPDYYWRTHDQFVALGAAAAVTSRIKLGTGITLVGQRDPIWTAKSAASVDSLSNGRFILGVGYGWNKEELAHHGVKYTERRDRLREGVLTMKSLWQDEEAEFHGEHFDLAPSWSWPKPATNIPVVLGGAAGPKTAAHIAEFCDGWMPIGARTLDTGWVEIQKACEAIDRDPAEIELGVFAVKPDAGELEALAAKNVKRALFALPQGPESEVLEAIDQMAEFL